MQESLAHGARLSAAAIQDNTAHNHKAQVLLPHGVDDLTKLLRASGKAGNLFGVSLIDFRTNTLKYYFLVILPNRSIATPAQLSINSIETQFSDEETQLRNCKTQSTSGKTQSIIADQDRELSDFQDMLLNVYADTLRPKTRERLLILFKRYRYTYHFNRRNIADMFSITENAASRFLKNCVSLPPPHTEICTENLLEIL